MQSFTDAAQTDSEIIRQRFGYWHSKCGPGAIPKRNDIDPGEIFPILPNILIVDFEQDPFRVKVRLVGTRIVEVTGY
ncbi:PAS domain-containing protein [Pelagibius marinus]|uniref:PAS domain-containing protein n=1 Tax=Pelagibius marinus TaxID=2762760 RepID=UPI0018732E9A|nr:PAS domain-containing protein [Pelagibius marinus]